MSTGWLAPKPGGAGRPPEEGGGGSAEQSRRRATGAGPWWWWWCGPLVVLLFALRAARLAGPRYPDEVMGAMLCGWVSWRGVG